ncbi:ATP/GTP-binding protein, partial [Streptomyces sp. SID8380]|nr:ATP/GTP-binding protein [Streptomyces sp. SID8380]
MSDEDEGTLVHGPWSDDSYVPPPAIPDYTDIPRPEPAPEYVPESENETTTEIPRLPDIPAAPDPAMALRSEGIPESAENEAEEYAEYEDGEYVQPRSLADRLGDWLELRLEMARTRHESEAPFREAEIARKAALLKSRTEQEVALAAANGKLRQAQLAAHGDRSSAHLKPATGGGGGGRGAGGGRGPGGGSGRGGGGAGSGRGSGSSGAGPRSGSGSGSGRGRGSGRGSGGGSPSHGSGKGPGSGSSGRGGGSKGNETKKDPKGRQNGSGGLGSSGRGGGGGGKNGPGGGRSPGRREERGPAGHRSDAGTAPASTRA